MPRWLGRLIWSMRGKRRVRIHLEVKDYTPVSTIEGILVGRWGGHYVLEVAKIVRAGDETVSMDARYVEIPSERVVFVEVQR